MKINALLLAFLALASATWGAPLAQTTTVHAKPDRSAAALAVLPAGTEPTYASATNELVPPGWQAVEVFTTQQVFVANRDISKSLDIRLGSTFRNAPKVDGTPVTTMEAGDQAEIIGVKGRWSEIRLQKKRIGFIPVAVSVPAIAAAPAPPPTAPAPAPPPAPLSPNAPPFCGQGRPVERINLGDSSGETLPRLFQGTFASSRRPLMPRRPYDFQLNDANGERYAYLDVSKLLLTEQIDKYLERTVVVYGTAKPVPNTRDIVISVESLQLR